MRVNMDKNKFLYYLELTFKDKSIRIENQTIDRPKSPWV